MDDELCPYCQHNKIAMTLTDKTGSYHICHVCAIQFGLTVQAVNVANARNEELALLNKWAEVPWPVNR